MNSERSVESFLHLLSAFATGVLFASPFFLRILIIRHPKPPKARRFRFAVPIIPIRGYPQRINHGVTRRPGLSSFRFGFLQKITERVLAKRFAVLSVLIWLFSRMRVHRGLGRASAFLTVANRRVRNTMVQYTGVAHHQRHAFWRHGDSVHVRRIHDGDRATASVGGGGRCFVPAAIRPTGSARQPTCDEGPMTAATTRSAGC